MSKTKELGKIIMRLHEGEDPEKVKAAFTDQFESVTSAEIIKMEQELVDDGMAVTEIQKLCDIHADVFNMSIEEIHQQLPEFEREGHPVKVLVDENRALEKHMDQTSILVSNYEEDQSDQNKFNLMNNVNELFDIDKHYARKEKSIFPLMEKYGFDAPPQVMWGVDDEIRDDLKAFQDDIKKDKHENLSETFTALRKRIDDMILKEEKIMLPMITDLITEEEWLEVAYDSEEIGYCLVFPKEQWIPKTTSFYDQVKQDLAIKDQAIHFKTGVLKIDELMGVLDALPLDITFIDKDDKFRYFNQAEGRVFVRSKAALGRIVQHCHPPRSVDMVEGILEDLKSGAKDTESFWIEMKGMLVHISYTAVRDEFGTYLGTLEVSHDVRPYQELEGQKRLR